MNNTLFTIHGFNIKANTLYQVTEKLDSSASDGFKDFKTTKAIHPDIFNSEPGAIFDGELGVWDNGMYLNSRALVLAVPVETERDKFVKEVLKNITVPLEKLRGKSFLSQHTDNNHFWDNYQIDIKKGKLFNTAKPEELLQLYLSILHMYITPKNIESHPAFKNSQFCIIDKEDSIDRKMEHEMDLMEATGTFYELMKNKPKDLSLILDYLKMSVSENTEPRVLTSMFNNWLKDKTDGFQNARVFLKIYKHFLTKEGEKEIFYYSKMKEFIKKGLILQKKNEIWFEEDFVGADLKSAVKTIMSNKDLEARLLEHIQ
jgi:hypothetical protein